MILILVGASGSGKSTLAKTLCRFSNFEQVVTSTTRPMRKGEENHVSYNFLTDEEFKKINDENGFLETSNYRGWHYGTPYPNKCENLVYVLTPAGARKFKKLFKDEVKIIFLDVDRRSRLIKLLERGDNVDEAYRRNLTDVGQFDNFEFEADYTLKNDKYTKTPVELTGEILQKLNIKVSMEAIKEYLIDCTDVAKTIFGL